MLNRKTYDILSVIALLLLLFGMFISIRISSELISGVTSSFESNSTENLYGNFFNIFESSAYKIFMNFGFIINFLVLVYCVLFIILSVEVYEKKQISTGVLVCMIVFVAVSPILYFAVLRKKFEEIESENGSPRSSR